MKDCNLTSLKGTFDGNAPKYGEFRFIAKKLFLRCSQDTLVTIITPNVTFVGGGTTATVGTAGTVLELSAQGEISIADKYAINVITLVDDNEVDITTLCSVNLVEVALGSQATENAIYGNLELLQASPGLKRFVADNVTDKVLSGDISKVLSKLNISGQLYYQLNSMNYDQYVYGNISALNHIAQVQRFYVSNAQISGSIENLTCLFYASAGRPLLNLRGCHNITGTVENFVASQRTAGHTTGNMEIYLRGTQCTYDGNPFTANKTYILTWDASTISLTEA